MANYGRNSYNAPNFTPFQSGCSICYPSKDYVNQSNQTGGKKKKTDGGEERVEMRGRRKETGEERVAQRGWSRGCRAYK